MASKSARSPALRRVLVVEDEADAADALRMLLEHFGHDVRVAKNVDVALAILREHGADVVLCDLGLPGGRSGLELAMELRRDAELESLPLIALTGHARRQDRDDALAAGFDGHLAKPAEAQEILETIRALEQRPGGPVSAGRSSRVRPGRVSGGSAA